VRRIPIRLRVAAAFAVAMALVLAGTGAFLYARLGRDLASSLDLELRLRAEDVAAIARSPNGSLLEPPSADLIERGESFSQLVTPEGRVLSASSPRLQASPLLDTPRRREALAGPRFADLTQIPGLDEGVRVLAVPVRRSGRRLVLIVGATAENRREALRSLRNELVIVGPLALLLATVLGYVLAGSGLRAVDAMRARAERISADRPDERLPVPATGDELQRLGQTLNEMLGRLQGAVERERAFVAEAGHELRTPLALLRAELDYALRYAETEEELRTALRTASEETDRLVALSGALLLISSSDRGRLELRREPLSVMSVMESVGRRFAWRAEELGRQVTVAGTEDGLTVDADCLRLEQALGNLVDNALRHGAGTVSLEAGREGESVALRVADEGPGFPDEVRSRAFARFSRGRDRRATDGAGLGLAIVRAIAEAHGGDARAGNRPGGGAEVTLLLPSAPPAGQPVGAASQTVNEAP
jgi:two-component system, OmpR family, sensor kinase